MKLKCEPVLLIIGIGMVWGIIATNVFRSVSNSNPTVSTTVTP